MLLEQVVDRRPRAEHGSREAGSSRRIKARTSNGLVGSYVTDWAGPEAMLMSVKIRLGAPNYPGDKMTMGGEVIAKREEGGKCIVDLAVAGKNSIGVHVSGTVVVDLLKTAP